MLPTFQHPATVRHHPTSSVLHTAAFACSAFCYPAGAVVHAAVVHSCLQPTATHGKCKFERMYLLIRMRPLEMPIHDTDTNTASCIRQGKISMEAMSACSAKHTAAFCRECLACQQTPAHSCNFILSSSKISVWRLHSSSRIQLAQFNAHGKGAQHKQEWQSAQGHLALTATLTAPLLAAISSTFCFHCCQGV